MILAARWWFVLVWILWSACGPASQADPGADRALRVATGVFDAVQAETLSNGLRVYLLPVPGALTVTTMTTYNVGSADESLDHTGLSHYLEHLMFKGTDKLLPGDIDRLTLRNGGHNNAYTSEDATVYHFDFAADRWQVALEIEADRMRNLRIDTRHEFEQEKGAVCAEIDRAHDADWEREYNTLLPLLFGDGPYGHPVLGLRDHVRGATAEVIKRHYDRWYHPNNAALVVVGGFEPAPALARIRALFGSIPAGNLPERRPAPTVRRDGPVSREVDARGETTRLVLGYNTCRTGDADYYALEVLRTVLAGGKTGRLNQSLVKGNEVAQAVDALNTTGRYPGCFTVEVQLLRGQERGAVEQLVLAELKRLGDEPLGPEELRRVHRILLAEEVFNKEEIHSLADVLARGVCGNDLTFLRGRLARLLAVTPGQLQQAARRYFDPGQRVAVWSAPRPVAGARTPAQPLAAARQAGRGPRMRGRLAAATPSGAAAGEAFSLRQAHREVLPNGLTLLLMENHRLPIVTASAFVKDVYLHETAKQAGIATLTGYLLEEGTDRHTGPEIAGKIEEVGGLLEFSASGAATKVLSPDRRLGLDLLLECLSRARFPREAFLRMQDQLLADIEAAEIRADARAEDLFHARVYDRHPFARSPLGTIRTVEAMRRAQVVAFHRKVFVPNNVILAVVGDFNTADLVEEVRQLTADWKMTTLPRPQPPAAARPAHFSEQFVSVADAAQIHFYLGHVGIRRQDPDYYRLLVMDYILGTGPGFTDRLSARLRDREGLAYTVSANITATAAEEPGTFTCYIGTTPEHLARVKAVFLEELERIRREPPSAFEVADAKQFLLGNLSFDFTTNGKVADQLINVERFHLGWDYLQEYRQAVAAVTPADVQAAAQRHIDPQRMVLVVGGPLTEDGKPLEKRRAGR